MEKGSWSEISRMVKVLNGEEEAIEGDFFKKGDYEKASSGNKSAITRTRKVLQAIKKLAQTSRTEVQEFKA